MTEGERVILDLVDSGFFRIDEDGSIWRLQRRSGGRVVALAEPVRADRVKSRDGYRVVRARIDGCEFSASARRIVWMSRYGPLPDSPAGHRPGPDAEDRIVALTRAGVSVPNIAQLVGVSDRTVVRVRGRRGIGQPWSGANPFTDDEKLAAAALLDDGASVEEVARTLHRSSTTVHRHFPGRAWSRVQAGQFAAMFHRVKGKLS